MKEDFRDDFLRIGNMPKINDPILRIFLSPLCLEATALVQGRLVPTRFCEDYVETFFHDHEFLIFSPLGRIARRFGSRVVGGGAGEERMTWNIKLINADQIGPI
jgi:hypothetical protein